MEKNIGIKGKENWYPKYAPHIILGTNTSILDVTFVTKEDLEKIRCKKYRYLI